MLLLFGLPISRIRMLRPEHLHDRDGGTYLALGRHPLLVPPKLATLLGDLAATPANRTRLAAGAGWLFPGRVPSQPAGPSGFSRKLLDHGIAARNAALIALVEDLPAPILAHVLGLHINTAVHWTQIARRDWTEYLIAREEDAKRGNTAPSE
ncbi:hypothetical protein [Actinomadura coerulea]|uniref:hypothetical protein n=1 Tax=Actinomadura coerulea TaxID=46159 RepID=UPI0034287786